MGCLFWGIGVALGDEENINFWGGGNDGVLVVFGDGGGADGAGEGVLQAVNRHLCRTALQNFPKPIQAR